MIDDMVGDTGFTIHGDRVELFKALAAAQAGFTEVLKTRENPFFKSKYADLADVLAACVPSLNKHGLALIQPPCRPSADSDWKLYTLLTHSSGAYFEVVATIPPVADWQKFGSAVTYCRRYIAGSLLGVAPEADDDGNAAVDEKPWRANQKPPPPPKAKDRYEPTVERSPHDLSLPPLPVLSTAENIERAQAVLAAAEASVGVERPSDKMSPGQTTEIKAHLNGKLYKDPTTGEVKPFTRPLADLVARAACGVAYPELKTWDQARKLLDVLRDMPDKVAS